MSHPFVDTHCHLDSILERLKLADFATYRQQFLPPDFEACLTISCDVLAIEPTLGLLQNDGVYGSFGLHPHDCRLWDTDLENRLLAALKHPKCMAYGEIGLDYHYTLSPVETQKESFAYQLALGIKAGKPLVIHTRKAEEDTLEILRRHVPRDWPIHVHCFTSSLPFAESLLTDFSRLYLGFTGIVTFKNAADLQEVARQTPLNRILLETDGPYLAPIPHRGEVAHPGHIPVIGKRLAEIKNVDASELFAATRKNTRDLYGI